MHSQTQSLREVSLEVDVNVDRVYCLEGEMEAGQEGMGRMGDSLWQ